MLHIRLLWRRRLVRRDRRWQLRQRWRGRQTHRCLIAGRCLILIPRYGRPLQLTVYRAVRVPVRRQRPRGVRRGLGTVRRKHPGCLSLNVLKARIGGKNTGRFQLVTFTRLRIIQQRRHRAGCIQLSGFTARLLAPLTLGGVGAWVGAPWDRHLGSVRIGRDVRFPKLSSILGG